MEFIPVKTRIMQPPKDDLFTLLDEYLVDVQEGDVVLVTSKIVTIHQGRCVPIGSVHKPDLVAQEADYLVSMPYWKYPLTIKYHALISAAGIDESNSDGYYTLLPENPFVEAQKIHSYLKEKHGLQNVGIIITDSHSLPFRYGAMSIAISFWGFNPVDRHQGKKDLFGREMVVSSTNIVDSLAAGAALVSGETAECQPIVIARGVPNMVFGDEDMEAKLLVPPEEDIYRGLFKDFFNFDK